MTRSTLPKNIDFYFDAISPYVWLASTQLDRLEHELGVEFNFVPILFAGLLNHHGTKGPAEVPARRRHTYLDVLLWSRHYGRAFRGPPTHPFNPLLPLRACTAVADRGERARLAKALMAAAWEHGQSIETAQAVLPLLERLGFDGPEILTRAGSPEVKNAVKLATEQALALGVFGIPTFHVGDFLFWGNDRIELMSRYLKGELAVDASMVEAALARPATAKR